MNKEIVSPFAGEWIEIFSFKSTCGASRSHPSRVSGLKYELGHIDHDSNQSHPSRVSGLKSYIATTS